MNVQFAFSNTPASPMPARDGLLQNLTALRQEWEAAAEGDNLLDVTASVGLMLLDVATKLGLTPDERAFFLGVCLEQEASTLLADRQD